MRKILLLLFITYNSIGQGLQFQEVSSANAPFEGLNFSSSALADVDGDNDLDVLITGQNSSGTGVTKLYLNNGSGNYTLSTINSFVGVWQGSVGIADIDNDSDKDLIITGINSSAQYVTLLYKNNGAGIFTLQTGTPFVGVFKSDIAFADLNNDGDLDLVISGQGGPNLANTIIYDNNGSGIFSEVTSNSFEGLIASTISVGDIDGDSDIDIFVSGLNISNQRVSRLYINGGLNTFTLDAINVFDGYFRGDSKFADFDNDNDLDLLITGENTNGVEETVLYQNNGSGVYTEITNHNIIGTYYSALSTIDLNNDNKIDILITGYDDNVLNYSRIYLNRGDLVFEQLKNENFVDNSTGSISVGDIDSDSDIDILLTGWNGNSYFAKLYKNTPVICTPNGISIDTTALDSYVSPNGNLYILSGTYVNVLQSANGCDSVITINLTINSSCMTPTQTQYSNVTSTSIQPYWLWKNGKKYLVRHQNISDGMWVYSDTLISNYDGIKNYTITGLQDSQTYKWQVQAICDSNTVSDYTTPFTWTTQCQKPSFNNSPTILSITDKTAIPWWTDFGIPLNFNFRYRISGDLLWNNILVSDTSLVELTGLSSLTMYEIQVEANCTQNVSSGFSNSLFFTTLSLQCQTTYATVDTTVSSFPYIAADGAYYYQAGTFNATIINTAGCDSVITINVLLPTIDQQNILDFEVSNGTTSWTEDSLAWQFVGGSDQTQRSLYNAFSGSGYGKTSSGSNSKLTFEEPISLQTIRVKYYGGMVLMPVTLFAYDPLNNVIASTTITPSGTYQLISLGWNEVSSISFKVPMDNFFDPILGSPMTIPQNLYFDELAYTVGNPPIVCQVPTIGMPVDLTKTDSSATVWWSGLNANTQSLNLQYRELGAITWNTLSIPDTTRFKISSLNASTTYQVQVEAVCAGNINSGYSAIESFTTLGAICQNTFSTIDTTASSFPYIAPDGSHYYQAGIYSATINNAAGCDSLITINVLLPTIDQPNIVDFEQLSGTTSWTEDSLAWQFVGGMDYFDNSNSFSGWGSGKSSSQNVIKLQFQKPLNIESIRIKYAQNLGSNTLTAYLYATDSLNNVSHFLELGASNYDLKVLNWDNVSSLLFETPGLLTGEVQYLYFDELKYSIPIIQGGSNICKIPAQTQYSNATSTSIQPYWMWESGKKYLVRHQNINNGTWIYSDTLLSSYEGIKTYTISGLQDSQNYQWQVKAICNDTLSSEFSTPFTWTTFCQPPQFNSTPVVSITDSSGLVKWGDFGIPMDFNLLYRANGQASWDTVLVDTTEILLSGLNPATEYEIKIGSICTETVSSNFSNSSYFTTLTPPCIDSYATIDTTVQNVYLSPSGQSYTLSGTYTETIENTSGCDSVITINLSFSAAILAYDTLTFEQQFGINNWTENGISWTFLDGLGYISDNSYDGLRAGFTFSSNPASLRSNQPIFIHGLYVLISGSPEDSTDYARIQGFDASGNLLRDSTLITLYDNLGTYAFIELNWTNVSQIRLTTTHGPCNEYPDTENPSITYTYCDELLIYFDNLLYSTNPFSAICSTPTQTQYSNATSTSIQPYWMWENGKKYLVRHKSTNQAIWTYSDTLVSNYDGIKTYTIVGLENDTTYQWQVKSICNDTLSSDFSTPFTWTTFCQPPQFNSTPVVSITDSSGLVKWGDFGIPMDFNLLYRANGQASWDTVLVDTTEILLSGLNPATEYEIKIGSICTETVSSNFSNSSYFTTLNPPCSNSYSTLDTTVQNTYLSPSGQTYTSSGTYIFTIENTTGCDSVISINLTVLNVVLQYDTLTFEQPFFTSNWIENGLNWHFADGWGDIRGYAAHGGGFSAMTISGSENKLISSQPINIKGLYLQLQGSPDYSVSQPHIYGYDAQGGLLYDSTLNGSFVYSFQFLELNWHNVSQIKITSPRGNCYSYPDFYWCDQVNIFYDDIIYTTVPVIDTLAPAINCPTPISACTFFEVPDYQSILEVSDNTSNRNQINIYQSIPNSTLLYSDTTLVITATDLAGNIDTCTILIKIQALIGTPIITLTTSEICSGTATSISATGCANDTIHWSNGQTGQNVSISPLVNTSYTAVCKNLNCMSDTSNLVSVSVIQSPAAPLLSVTNRVLCNGDSLQIVASGCESASLVWSNGAMGDSIIVKPNLNIILSVHCIQNGCNSPTTSVNIEVYEKPIIIADTTDLCADSTVTLHARGINNTTKLQWYKDGIALEGATDSLLNVTMAGNYSVVSMKAGNQTEWIRQNPDSENHSFTNTQLREVHFIDNKRGWALGVSQVFYTSDGGKTWSIQITGNYEEYWNKIQMLNDTLGYISSGKGNVIKTTNGGQTWTYLPTGTNSFLYGIHFIDNLEGWAVGSQGTVIKTIDGGNTWNSVTTPISGTNKSALSVHFLNKNKGFIGLNEVFETLVTIDGGQTWSNDPSLAYIWEYQFINDSTGYSLGAGGLRKTTDAGQNWVASIYNLSDFNFVNDSLGFIVDSQNQFFKTTNSGATWTDLPVTVSSAILSIDFISENQGWAVGNGGQIFKFQPILEVACLSDSINISITLSAPQITSLPQTICAGQTVNLAATGCLNGTIEWNTNQTGRTIAVQPANSQIYKAVCKQFSCISDSSNAVLITVNPSPAAPILSIGDITICKGDSLIISAQGCSNGSIIWSNSYSGSSQIIYPTQNITLSAYCQPSTGCQSVNSIIHVTVFEKPYIYSDTTNLCADSTIILRARGISDSTQLQWYKDGVLIEGATDTLLTITSAGNYSVASMKAENQSEWVWLSPNSVNNTFNNVNVRDLDFLDSNIGFAITDIGIYKTIDGGKKWVIQKNGNFRKIRMLNSFSGFVSGYDNILSITTNGGETWESKSGNPSDWLLDFDFFDTLNGIIIYGNNSILKTSDGGNSWTIIPNPPQLSFGSIYRVNFPALDRINLIGVYGGFYRTNDLGQNWSSSSFTLFGFGVKQINFINDTTGFVLNSNLNRTFDSGNSWLVSESNVNTFKFFNNSIGWLGNSQGEILKTTNSGNTWINTQSPILNNIRAIDFVNENEGWAVGDAGQILKFQPKMVVACTSDRINISNTLSAPQITSFPQTICGGQTVNLTATGCVNGIIKWNTNQTGSTIAVQPAVSQIYKAVCQQFSCISDSSNAVLITVNPSPAAPILSIGDTTICKGDSLLISSQNCSNGTLVWSNGYSGNTQTVIPVENMTLSVFCQSSNGCQSLLNNINITVYNKPYLYADTTNLCADSTVTLHARGISQTTKLQWFKNGIIIDEKTDSLLIVTAPGNYSVASMKNGSTASWKWQNPNSQNLSITSSQLRDVDFVDSNKGWAIGAGQIFNTIDGGKNWNAQFNGSYWNKIQMVNDSVGYAASGSGTIVKTTNGGVNWNYTPTGVTNYFLSMHFSDVNHGWAVGDYGTIIKTVDGGQSWQSVTSPLSGSYYSYEGVYFTSPDTGYVGVSGFNYGLKTIDGGQTWVYKYDFPAYTNKFQFTSSQVGYLMGNDMRKTTNGGNTWSYIGDYAMDFHFVNDSVGFKSNINGIVQKTTNGGVTWTPLNTPSGEHMWAIDFINDKLGWAVGGNGNILNYSTDLIMACESNSLEVIKGISAPQITSLSQTICGGKTVNLNATGCTNGTIKWNTNQIGSTITVQPASSQIYKAVCQQFSCISDSSNAVLITINPSPSAPILSIGDITICKGDSLIISAQGCSNGTIIWSNSYSGSSQIIYPTQNTTLSAYCQSSSGCQSVNSIIHITVFEKPYIFTDTSNLCADSTITLRARGISKTTQLQWYKDGVVIEGATDTLLTITSAGNYSVSSMKVENQSEWVWLNPKLPVNEIFDSYFINQIGWNVGNGGLIQKTIDGGATWKKLVTPISGTFKAVYFVNENIGWVVGYPNLILKTVDGGNSWIQQNTSLNYIEFRGVSFSSSSEGIIVGTSGTILKTIDGGQNWLSITSGTYQSFNEVQMVDNQKGWIAGDKDNLLKTIDGGATWTNTANISGGNTWNNFKDLIFKDALHGWAVGESRIQYSFDPMFPPMEQSGPDVIYRTTDGGNTWLSSSLNNTYNANLSVSFANNTVGWLSNENGSVFKTTNGGQNWASVSNLGYKINSIVAINDNLIYAFGVNGNSLKSSDGGYSWLNSQITVTSSSFKKVDFTSKQKGWTIAGTQIFHTDNGGKTWSLQFTGDFWNDIQMLNDTLGYVASSYGQIAKTTNGGQDWTYTPTNTSAYLFDIDFSDTQNGWAVGDNGTVIHTTNGGQSWTAPNTPITGSYSSSGGVYFINANTGFVSGYGFVMKTVDGGLNWTTTNGVTSYAGKMQFTSENIGYLMGNEMMKTTNGGQSWSTLSDYAIDFFFLNDTLGWKAGIQGSVLKTTNGGLTWKNMNAPTSNHINAIDFRYESEGWAVGNGGQILKFQPKLEVACLSDSINISKILDAPQITSLPQTICGGQTVNLTATGCINGTIKWNNNQTGSTIFVQPVFTTTYRVICQQNSCTSDSSNMVIITVKTKSFSTISVAKCDKFMSPSGKFIYTTSGIYKDTLNNSVGCDSIITINLTIKRSTYSTNTLSRCESYISPSGRFTWTTSGIYKDTILNAVGCDSIITINLNIIKKAGAIISGNKIISAGQSATLSVTLSGTAPYTLTINGVVYSNINQQNFSFNVSPTQTTTYAITSVTNNTCGIGTWSGSAIVTVDSNNPCPSVREIQTGISSSGTYKAGETIKSSATVSNQTFYKAGKSVELNPGFKVDAGVTFKAEIGGCDN